jgi:spore coat polysaccharide biosynthesis protein SpsF
MQGSRKIVAIIQARMGSSRLPGKVLADIGGQPMLHHVVRRTQLAKSLDAVVVATSTAQADEAVARCCVDSGIACFRGSEDDVLDRYHGAATHFGADTVVRLTADCPFLDPEVIDKVVATFDKGLYDYVSNTLECTYPDGLDTEVFTRASLDRAWREARWRSEREHVTPFIKNHPELFRLRNVSHRDDLSAMRWTVDEPSDLEFARRVYSYFTPAHFRMADMLALLSEFPAMATINAAIGRDEGYRKSVREDALVAGKEMP